MRVFGFSGCVCWMVCELVVPLAPCFATKPQSFGLLGWLEIRGARRLKVRKQKQRNEWMNERLKSRKKRKQ